MKHKRCLGVFLIVGLGLALPGALRAGPLPGCRTALYDGAQEQAKASPCSLMVGAKRSSSDDTTEAPPSEPTRKARKKSKRSRSDDSSSGSQTIPAGSSAPAAQEPTGLYRLQSSIDFDSLDGAAYDPATQTLSLFGHRTHADRLTRVDYLDLLAAALESDSPIFSLEWTPASRRELDAAEERNYTNASDVDLVNKLGTMFDASGSLNSIGAWWYKSLGADVTQGMDRYQANGRMLAANGQELAGQTLPAFGDWVQTKKRGDDQAAFQALLGVFSILGIYDEVHEIGRQYHDNEITESQMHDKLWPLFLRHLATAFGWEEDRFVGKYTNLRANGQSGESAADEALFDFQNELNSLVQGVLRSRLDRLSEVVFPPEIMKQVIGVEPRVQPVFTRLPEHSQLARVALEADVFCKSLMDMPGLSTSIPGYQTFFDWVRARNEAPENEDGHIWTSPDGFQIFESADGRTMRFGRTAMRFHMEKYLAGGRSVSEPRLDQYGALLTGCYDDLAEQYPILHELRESTKVVAVAQWLKRRGVKLSLPRDGRVYWNAPAELPGIIYLTMAANSARAGQINEILTTAGGVDFCGDNDLRYSVGDAEAPKSDYVETTIRRTKEKVEQILGKKLETPAPQPVGWVTNETVGGQTVSTVSIATAGVQSGSASDLTLQRSPGDQAAFLWKQGDLEVAEKAYRDLAKSSAGDPTASASARLLLAEVLHEKGDNAAAIKELNEAVRLSPNLPLAQLLYAKALSESGDVAGAQEALRAYLLLDPTNLAAVKVLADLGDVTGAQEALRTYLCLDPTNLAAVKVLADLGDVTGAQEALRNYLRLDPTNLAAVKVLADLGDAVGAQEALHNYLRLDPTNLAAAKVLADLQGREKGGAAPPVAAPIAPAPITGFAPSVRGALDPNGPLENVKNTAFFYRSAGTLVLGPRPLVGPQLAQTEAWKKLEQERDGLVTDYQHIGFQLEKISAQKAASPSNTAELDKQASQLQQQLTELAPKIEKVKQEMVSIQVNWGGGTSNAPSGSSPAGSPPPGLVNGGGGQ